MCRTALHHLFIPRSHNPEGHAKHPQIRHKAAIVAALSTQSHVHSQVVHHSGNFW